MLRLITNQIAIAQNLITGLQEVTPILLPAKRATQIHTGDKTAMRSEYFFFTFLILVSIVPGVASASSIKGTALGEISGCDYYAIEDASGDYTVAEWYGGVTPYEGDSVVGELHSYGFKDLYDISRDRSTHVWLEDWLLSEDRAMEILIDKCGWSSDLKNYFDGGSSYYNSSSYPSYTSPATSASSCPANSTAVGTECYCNTGYKAVGSACVLDTPTCPANASMVGTSCQCNSGYVASGSTCITASANCQATYGPNSYGDSQYCYCSTGYQFNTTKTSCVLSPVVTTTSTPEPSPATAVTSPKAPVINNFEVPSSDIETLDGKATLKTAGAFRKCPSTECSIIRYYTETSEVSISGKYKSGDWYRVEGTTDAGWTGQEITGWINQSLFGTVSVNAASNAETKHLPIEPTQPVTTTPEKKEGFIARIWNAFLGWFHH